MEFVSFADESGSETFHPNIQLIGEAEKLTNFQFLPIGE